MKTKRKLNPGQPGTKKLVEKFGDDLVCVRYRYDSAKKRRFKTVELIVDESSWEKKKKEVALNNLVEIRVGYEEIELREKIKAKGAKWNKIKKVWQLSYKDVVGLDLTDRVVNIKNV